VYLVVAICVLFKDKILLIVQTQRMIINGKDLAQRHITNMQSILANQSPLARQPELTVILVGDRPDSASYVKMKQQTAAVIGINVNVVRFNEHISMDELASVIDRQVILEPDGIIVQLPLPAHLDAKVLIDMIPPHLDVDGLTTTNLGLVMNGRTPSHFPCTPAAVLDILESVGVTAFEGKCVVLIGCGELVGKPLAVMLMHLGATVVSCNKHTQNIVDKCKLGDIVIAAAGVPQLVKSDWIKDGAIVIDVGVSSVLDDDKRRRLVGDVDFENVRHKVSAITPVPGGVGPMTVVMLMRAVMKRWLSR